MKRGKSFISLIVTLSIILSLTVCAGSSEAADNTVYTWRIGTGSGGNNNNPYIWYMEQIKETVEKRSDGRIKVQLYPSGQLGTLMELSQGLTDGTVDTALIPTQYYTSMIPDMFILDISYQFKDDMEAIEILNKNDTILEKHMLDKGIIAAAWIRLFPRITISNRKVETLDNWKGLKLWFAPSALLQNKAAKLGVVACNFDLGELAASLQNGTVDGCWTDYSLMAGQSLFTSAPYILESPKDILISVLAISKIWFNKLPSDLQTLVLECANEVAKAEYVRAGEVEVVFKGIITKGGGKFYDPSDTLTAAMIDTLKGESDWLLKNYPQVKDAYNELQKLIEAHRQ